MARISRLPIDVEAGFPQRFQCRIAGVLLGFEVRYNPAGDFYTVDIMDQTGDVIVHAKPVIYGADLFAGVVDDRLPDVMLIAADTAGAHEHAGHGALGVDVHLWVMGPVA